MLSLTDQQPLVARLNRVEGQMRGIKRMVQDQRAPVEIIQQIVAAEGALNRVSLALFRRYVDERVFAALASGIPERGRVLDELRTIVEKFAATNH